MWAKVLPICLLALQVFAYEEILPSQTLNLEARDAASCTNYHGEVRSNGRRIGYLHFNNEGSASVTKNPHSAALLHNDSDGRPRAGKSYIGTKKSARKHSTLKSMPHKKGAVSQMPDNLCYSKKTKTIYSGSTPQRLECTPVTVTPSCVKHQPKPNPSDGAYPKSYTKRSVEFNPAWEAMRAAL